MLKNLTTSHVVLGLAALAVLFALATYGAGKSGVMDAMSPSQATYLGYEKRRPDVAAAGSPSCCVNTGGNPQPSQPLGQNEVFSNVAGSARTNTYGLPPSCARQPVVDPKQLLPKNNKSQWGKLNPQGEGDLQNVNLLQAGYHIGINTVGQSLRNANLQLRSEPPNPQIAVGPWNTTTIQPDLSRRPLEIGCGPR